MFFEDMLPINIASNTIFLTSEEIINYRALLGMSQVAFANYLKVGEASIKRWETYFVQDVVQDDHIRFRCILTLGTGKVET
jgi:hypothetical protein